jgi:hypothetical protein
MHTKNSESGQAIVLIVLAMIALLGFTALAVDGSMVLSDRRWAQNVSDTSALAGGGTAAQNLENQGYIYRVGQPWGGASGCPNPVDAAIAQGLPAAVARATENDYNLPVGITEEFGGIEAECVWDGPLPYIDFTAVVKKTTDAAFSQVVFSGLLENTTTAVARIRPSLAFGWGRSIVALNDADCQGNQNGLQFSGLGGSNYLDVIQGGVFSNGCLDVDGNADVTIVGGSAEYFDPGDHLDRLTFLPDPVPPHAAGGLNQLTNPEYRMARADYMPQISPLCNAGNTYTDNTFHDLEVGGVIDLDPGLYCIDDNHGLRINNNEVVTGEKVTFVILNGDVAVDGGAMVTLSAPERADPDGTFADAIRGLLWYVPPTNTGCQNDCITLNGNSSTFYEGTILAPGNGAEVRFLGNNGADLYGQIIGWDVFVEGSANSTVTYNPESEMVLPTYLNVQR